jgi:hypothetical protein
MELVTPFAQTPSTPEPIIAQVRRQLADDDQVGARVPTGVLDRVADRAVRELWDSPVRTFVPILALRQAREVLREQDRLITEEHLDAGSPAMPRIAPAEHDGLVIQDDVMPRNDRDILHF